MPDAVRIRYRGAFDWPAILDFFARRAIDGVERVDGRAYRRAVAVHHGTELVAGILTVTHELDALVVTMSTPDLPAGEVGARVRRMFDLDTDLLRINADLARDPFMAALVAANPAMRVPGGWDPFEVGVRTIIGQQVSVGRARQLNGELVARCGSPLTGGAGPERWRTFPTPQQVLDADLTSFGMPGARAAAVKTLAAAALERADLFARGPTLEETVARLRGLRGIGDWTAHYIAMRACREPDAFPASDVGLLRGAAGTTGRRPTPEALTARAEAWRPWRAYAAHQLWAADSIASGGVLAQPAAGTLDS